MSSDAIAQLLEEFTWNEWFIKSYWPENEFRVRAMVRDALQSMPPPARLFDIGCFNGFNSFLYSRLGYQVTATDATEFPENPDLFNRAGVKFFHSNLNEQDAFSHLADGSFDVVLFGEVIEHILNHPLGLMREIARVLTPGGLLLLTTPNPLTLMNILRVLRGTYTLWGTQAFIDIPKIQNGKTIDIGDVHFREYTTNELRYMLGASGFTIKKVSYFPTGANDFQPMWKRLAKSTGLLSHRLLASTQYVVASK